MENTEIKEIEIDVEEQAKEQEFFERQYRRKISDMFLSESIPLLNKMVGLNGKEQFSLGLFLKLPVNVQIEKVEEKDYFVNDSINFKNKYEEQNKIVEFIIKNFKAFVIAEIHTRKVEVNMVFKYRDQKDLDNLLDAIRIEIGAMFLVFVYLHEIQHILRRHATATFNDIMLRTAKKVDAEKFKDYYKDVHYFANCAQDYSINNSLLSMLKKSGNYNLELNVISQFGLFEEKYIKDNEIDILEKILNQQPDIKVIAEDEHSITLEIQEKNEDGTPNGDPKIVTVPKQGGEGEGQGEGEEEKEEMEKKLAQDKLMDAIADSIENHIEQQQNKGDGSFVLNKDLGESVKTNVDWFDQLKSTLFTIVNRKTRQTLVNWSKLNSKYSHSHKSPTHRNIENTLDIILSVDNSGSMCDNALKKLLYIIEEKKGKINKLTILKHTDTITQVLENEKDEKKILEFLGTRDNGGTSHKDVFRYLDENISKHEIDKAIYISFSDNYSDIESEYYNYKNIQRMTKVWLNADGVDVRDNISGMKVKIF